MTNAELIAYLSKLPSNDQVVFHFMQGGIVIDICVDTVTKKILSEDVDETLSKEDLGKPIVIMDE